MHRRSRNWLNQLARERVIPKRAAILSIISSSILSIVSSAPRPSPLRRYFPHRAGGPNHPPQHQREPDVRRREKYPPRERQAPHVRVRAVRSVHKARLARPRPSVLQHVPQRIRRDERNRRPHARRGRACDKPSLSSINHRDGRFRALCRRRDRQRDADARDARQRDDVTRSSRARARPRPGCAGD